MLSFVERGIIRSEIQLSAAASFGGKPQNPGLPQTLANPDIQILRTGKFNHPRYGEFEITTKTLSDMIRNFTSKVRGIDIALDYFHLSDNEASGWLTELYLNNEDQELWGKVDWTPKAQRMLAEREVRYFSPDFAFQWQDPETGVGYENVLFGGGLTNRPFVKDMAAIVAAEQKEEKMKLEEMEKQVKKLAEEGDDLKKKHADLQSAHDALKSKLAEYEEKPAPAADSDESEPDEDDMDSLKKKLSDAMGRNSALEKELAEMKEKKQLAEREAAFTVLFTEGKACAAQKESYIKGDMEGFIKLAQPVNVNPQGHNTTNEEGELADRILKLAEKKLQENPKMTKVDAISAAQREVK